MLPSFVFTKRFAVHAAFVALMGTIAWQGRAYGGVAERSLLYSLIADEEVSEGPLDPAAYAQTDGPGVGGARLAAVDASAAGIDIITFEDPEVEFAETLGGNAVVAPLQPLVPEPGSDEDAIPQVKKARVYTIADGDTIASIAAKFDISENTVLWANGLDSNDVIHVGDHLTILPTTGVLHTVASGDTVSEIAGKYDVKSADIIAYNNLGEGAKLSIGQKIIVPDGYIAPRQAPPIVSSDTQIAEGPTPPPAPAPGTGLIWPTTTQHISQYFRWGHTGIDIDNRSRPAVYAAADGTVEFAGWLGGYGKLLVVNHGAGLKTYYAHVDKFYAAQGQTVGQGEAIAQMGSTGRSSGPHLHYEVRQNGRPVNPLGLY